MVGKLAKEAYYLAQRSSGSGTIAQTQLISRKDAIEYPHRLSGLQIRDFSSEPHRHRKRCDRWAGQPDRVLILPVRQVSFYLGSAG